MSERSCPVSGTAGGRCPASGLGGGRGSHGLRGPRGCSFSGYCQPGDIHAAFDIPRGVDAEEWLRLRERKTINEIIYSNIPSIAELNSTKNIDSLTAKDHDLLAAALGAPARQVILRAEEVGPRSGWRDGYLSSAFGFEPADADESPAALASSPGRIWSDLCERMPGCVARGRVRESVAALPLVQGTEDVIPDAALWAACTALGMICSIYRYEENNDGNEGVSLSTVSRPMVEMGDEVIEEVKGIPKCVGLPYFQVSKRLGRAIPHLSFVDQSSYNTKVRDPKAIYPYVGRFDNIDLRWPMFGERTEIAFLKGCADTSASFQHGPDAIASCQEHVMNRNVEGLLREMIRLKEILERMPNAFHSISPNPSSGDNFVSAEEWVRWGQFSKPLSKRCAAASGLQFPPYLLMDAFLGRKKYGSFLGAEGIHLRAWQPANLRAFIAAVEYHYSIPDFVAKSGDPRLMGVLDGIVEAYCGERGFMGVHRYKVFGILEVAAKTGRTETNGASGAADGSKPWEETHRQFSESMKERLEPYRGDIAVEPNQMRGTFAECRYKARVFSRAFVDNDPDRSIAGVTLDIQNTGITFQPGDRLAVMPLNSWEECAKVAAALGLDALLDAPVKPDAQWARFGRHLESVSRTSGPGPALSVKDVLRRGHLAPLTQELVLKVHSMLRASSSTVLQVLATDEWPVRGSLGDLLQTAVLETPPQIWDQAFGLQGDLGWLGDLISVEVPRTYSISSFPDELLPSTVDLTVSRSEYQLCPTFAGSDHVSRAGVSSGFLNPTVTSQDEMLPIDEEILVGVSRPVAFQLPIDGAAPCAFFAGGSGIAPFRSFWQARVGRAVGRNILYLGVQSRDKFCYENELRQYVSGGQMEVHIAFSRDSRGLVYDPFSRDLLERKITPRYIDSLIVEEGRTICDMVMSKKQGGNGGYLYVCGSTSVFESVMNGIKRAIYLHRTATMESADSIVSTAFAERRFMLDIFMTPKPLPCNLPTVAQSQLALNTGHRSGGRMWIGVHGKVYDITEFCPMHPGGTLIIKSNAGVDCSKSFDNLAHTNNPEVSSLLSKYFVGHLTPRPDFHGCGGAAADELGALYDLWADYLRTSVETLVAQSFEMNLILGEKMDSPIDPSMVWFQGNLFSIKGVRMFYKLQSRLLQNGFSALFGPKFQELVLKLSFALANAASAGAPTRLPDVLGVIARAKTSADAVATTREISSIGHFIGDSEGARFHEQGIIRYATQAIELDMSLLEDIRSEACYGMDAFDALAGLRDNAAGGAGPEEAGSDQETMATLATFLMQVLERMAKRLEIFYSKLAQLSVYNPQIEQNPARTRWHLVRHRIRDGSFFILTRNMSMASNTPSFQPRGGQRPTVEFDQVMNQVRNTLAANPAPVQYQPQQQPLQQPGPAVAQTLNSMHRARTEAPRHGSSAFESFENGNALSRMTTFIDRNQRAIRRLSRLPPAGQINLAASSPVPMQMPMSTATTLSPPLAHQQHPIHRQPAVAPLATPPSSRSSSRSVMDRARMSPPDLTHAALAERRLVAGPGHGASLSMTPGSLSGLGIAIPPTPPLTGASAMASMMGRLNVRGQNRASSPPGPRQQPAHGLYHVHGRQPSVGAVSVGGGGMTRTGRPRTSNSTGSLRSFKLRELIGQEQGARSPQSIQPTF